MTTAEFVQSLKDTGIIDEEGNLTPQYAPPKKRKRKKSAAKATPSTDDGRR